MNLRSSPLLRAVVLAAPLLFLAGCPKSEPPFVCSPSTCASGCCGTDGGCQLGGEQTQCGSGGAVCATCGVGSGCQSQACKPIVVPDAGFDAGPPPCTRDDECSGRLGGSRCDVSTGQCIAATGCNGASDCQSQDINDYCYQYGVQCRCVQTGNQDGGVYSGVCRRRLGPCDPCTSDAQCGDDGADPGIFDPPGKCKPLTQGGPSFCLYKKQGSCGCGLIDDQTGYCKPQSGSCESTGCTEDKNCPGGSICNVAACLCESTCRWDFATKELAPPYCPTAKPTCWVDNANLDPTSIRYGSGRCKPACTDSTQCTNTGINPQGGDKLKCAAEVLNGGGLSEKRCRANGQCMDDLECPEQPSTSEYFGYCDRGSFNCKTDCRLGNDPVRGLPYKDCRPPYTCAPSGDGGTENFCRLQTCKEQGGAIIACRGGQFCCGEDKDLDGQPDPCPPAAELGPDKCYDAPRPPFCTTCASDTDCTTPNTLPSWQTCANQAKNPSCSTLPNKCIGVTMNTAVCAPATLNDRRVDSAMITNAQRGCPAGDKIFAVRPRFTDNSATDYCNTDDECRQGGNDAGRCAPDQALRLPDGGVPKACLCTAGGAAQCPNTSDGGVRTQCLDTTPGLLTNCIESLVCLSPNSELFSAPGAPTFGCGFMP